MANPRAEQYDLYAKLYNSNAIERDQILRLLDILVAETTARLVAATDTSAMLRIQGEVRALDRLRTKLTTAPVTSQE